LAVDLLKRMAENRADFTLTFRRLCFPPRERKATREYGSYSPTQRLRTPGPRHGAIASKRARGLAGFGDAMANPAFIPRNHMVQAVLDAAIERQDFQPFEELLDVVSRPYEDRPGLERYTTPAAPRCVSQTFLRDIETVLRVSV